MNIFAKLLGVVALFASVQSFADSRIGDIDRMYQCGGVVILSSAANGDLALKFEGRGNQCNHLRFFDVTSGRTLKSYQIQGSSYTLSKSMRDSLSSDCRVGFTVSGPYARDTFNVVLPWCSSYPQPRPRPQPAHGYSYQLSNAGNCKLMKYGQYANLNVEDAFCAGARSKNDVISYEFSNAGNCKRMINGSYSNVNVAQRFCTDRH